MGLLRTELMKRPEVFQSTPEIIVGLSNWNENTGRKRIFFLKRKTQWPLTLPFSSHNSRPLLFQLRWKRVVQLAMTVKKLICLKRPQPEWIWKGKNHNFKNPCIFFVILICCLFLLYLCLYFKYSLNSLL